jgi:hypothetical protein
MPLNNLASAAEIAIGERLLIGSGAIAYMLRQCGSCANSSRASGLRNSNPDRKITIMPSRWS